jgi:hypothetical protein
VDAVTQFRGERELVDDLTLVAIELQPAPSGTSGNEVPPPAVAL